MSNGFFSIPRSLYEHSTVVSAPHPQFRILIYILCNMAYKDCIQDDHGKQIHVKPRQLLITERELEKQTKTKPSTAGRALKRFSGVGILHQEVQHRKTLITYTYSECYDNQNESCEAESEAKVKQECSKSEAQKNKVIRKEGNKVEDTNVSSCSEPSHSRRSKPKPDPFKFNLELATWEGITDADHDLWKQCYPNINHGQELARAASWIIANPTKMKKLWRKFINGWFTRAENDAYYRLAREGQEALYKGNPPSSAQLDMHYRTKKPASTQQNKNYQDTGRANHAGVRNTEYDGIF